MTTSRPIRVGEWLTDIRTGSPFIGSNIRATVHEVRRPQGYILQSDFGLDGQVDDAYWQLMRERVFGMAGDGDIHIAITNGTAPGLYVREGDDTSDWEAYRQVLARRVEEAMATRRGGEGGVGVGETVTTVAETTTMRQQPRQVIGVLSDGREVAVDPVTGYVVPAPTTRQDDEIRVGDVVEVVSNTSAYTMASDVGGGGRITRIENSNNVRTSYVDLEPCQGLRLPVRRCAGLPDVRKVTSPSPSSPQTVAVNFSPMPDEEASRIEAAVSDEVRRRISSQLVSSSDGTTRQRVVNPVPPTAGVYIGPATIRFDDRAFTGIITATSPLRRGEPPVSSPPTTATPPTPSRFSLLEVDADPSGETKAPTPQAPKASTGLAALQQELRAEREARRALAAAQTPPGRFDLLECDLPAVPAAAAVMPAKAPPQRPVVSSPPKPRPKTHNPVETITDLTAARSPLELARMLEGLNDELSTMMRQREAN